MKTISVIIPFYNEEDNVESVLQEIQEVCQNARWDFEIIAVDDGSSDRTTEILKKAAGIIPQLKITTHSRNYGKDAALSIGYSMATKDIIVTLDGDGQNDFHDVPKMVDALNTYDAVFGQRACRQDPFSKLIVTRIAFFFRRLILNDNVRDTGCALKAMKRETLRYLIPINGVHRFIPFLFKEAGIPFVTVEVNHRHRTKGKSKFSLCKLYFFSTIVDLFFMWWFKKRNLLRFQKKVS